MGGDYDDHDVSDDNDEDKAEDEDVLVAARRAAVEVLAAHVRLEQRRLVHAHARPVDGVCGDAWIAPRVRGQCLGMCCRGVTLVFI